MSTDNSLKLQKRFDGRDEERLADLSRSSNSEFKSRYSVRSTWGFYSRNLIASSRAPNRAFTSSMRHSENILTENQVGLNEIIELSYLFVLLLHNFYLLVVKVKGK